jgi:hypothetical protein
MRLGQYFFQLAQPISEGYKLNPYPFHESHAELFPLAVSRRSQTAAKYPTVRPVTSEIFLVVSWLISLG